MDRIYAPMSVKAREGRFGEELRVSFKVEKLRQFLTDHANRNGYVNLTITRRRNVSQYGDTHTVVLDTWEPGQRAASAAPGGSDDDNW